MESFAKDLSRTLALSNQYLLLLLEEKGLEGLAPSHGDILVELFSNEAITMSELSQRIARDPSTVTVLVKKLIALGLAHTEKGCCDRRQTVVSLTEKGQALKSDFAEISGCLSEPWHEGISDERLKALSEVLAEVRGNLRTHIAQLQTKSSS